MVRWVAPLLLGLGVCAITGCASPGTRFNLARMSWTPNRPTHQEPANLIEPTETVAFRAPRRDPIPVAGLAEASSFTGHSSNLLEKSDPRESAIKPVGHQFGGAANDRDRGWTGDRQITDAGYRSDRDATDNPIQLQGIVADQENLPTIRDADAARDNVPQAWLPDGERDAESQGTHTSSKAPTGSWESDLDRLIARTERELSAMTPGTDSTLQADYRRRQIHLRLLHLIADHPEQSLIAIPSLEPAEQEYWQKMVWAMADSLDAKDELTSHERADQAISRVSAALRMLREQGELSIRNAAFCEEISYFGNYKRFPKEEFVPGQPVLLYAELENFRSELQSETSEYRTLLRSQIEILGATGQRRWKKNFSATEDVCRNPRRDYFHNYQFTIPAGLPLGPHVLKLTVVDELSGKQATTAIKFIVK